MSRRPNNLETVKLALEILHRIPRSRKITALELHQQLLHAGIDRDLRTVQRQLEALTAHFDIERDDRSKPYGYRWKAHSKGLSLPGLNEQESLVLALAQRYLQNLMPASLMKSMEGFFSQARINLDPYSSKKAESEWLEKVRVVDTTQPLLPPKIDAGVFEAVSLALYKNVWLEVDYLNASGKRARHNVMPLGLAQQGPRLYLVCRFEGYENERSLAIHRIKAAAVSGLTFTRPEGFSLEKYDDDARFGFGEGEHIRLSFKITKVAGQHLLETPLSEDQRGVEHDDHFAFTATVVDSERLDWWLRGFGDQAWGIEKSPAP
ncbi:MAG TPA: WYL domain-containing protein [Burkholderiaceae bacterium]|nr:WYL domain-containing protein [Burkholderiaceae bacterium]